MTADNVIKAQLFLLAWREGHAHGGLDNSLSVAFVVRNRVRAGWHGGSWLATIENHGLYSASTEAPDTVSMPDLREPNVLRLLQQIDALYEGSLVDKLTIAPAMKGESRGALFYGELHKPLRSWFQSHVIDDPAHLRTSQVGQVTFFA